jgi:hypothetical protein
METFVYYSLCVFVVNFLYRVMVISRVVEL